MRTTLLRASAVAALVLSQTAPALAAPPRADLQVQMSAPATSPISTAATYTVTVKNNGPQTATNTRVTVSLPLTNTSPTVHILGTVSAIDSRCSIVANTLSCAFGDLRKGKTATFTYGYAAPVSTKTLQMTAVGVSNVTDPVSSNNTASVVPNLTYPARDAADANVENSHCTGTNLTSYFECALFPSSISSHNTTLNAGGTITFTEPGYTGTWSQNAAKTTLSFEYFEATGSGSTKVAEFNGYAINGSDCFDGMTTFFPATTYVSPYHVCVLP